MDLETTLARVCRNCLRGQPVPADLRALWAARLRGEADLLEGAELTLVDDLGDGFLDGYGEAVGAPAVVARAHRRMFDHLAFIGFTTDGGLLGYDLGEGNRPVADAPVVELDGTGRYALKGTSVAEYLLQLADSPDDFAVIRDWLVGHGIPVGVAGRPEIADKLRRFEDPNARFVLYQDEEQGRGG
jgi:hypothetical protein